MPRSSQFRGEEELVLRARGGDDDAFLRLIDQYAPMVKSRARAFAGAGLEPDDLAQEGMIGLLGAIRVYDRRQSSFSTFARLCVDRMLTAAVRQAGRQKRIPPERLVPIDGSADRPAEALLASGEESDPAAILIVREEAERLRRRASRALSDFEYQALSAYLRGESYEEMAGRFGATPKAIDNALQRVRRKLRNS